jgi:hypothetical protein
MKSGKLPPAVAEVNQEAEVAEDLELLANYLSAECGFRIADFWDGEKGGCFGCRDAGPEVRAQRRRCPP